MKLKSIAIVAAVALAVTVGTTTTAMAAAPTAHAASPHKATQTYSDAQVVQFLAAGQGPMAKHFPQLVQYVPHAPVQLNASDLQRVLTGYRAVDPAFHAQVVTPLQSGDPYVTLGAVKRLEQDSAALEKKQAGVSPNVSVGDCATVLAVALAVWLVLAVFVTVPAAVTPESSDSTLTNESFAAALAKGFTPSA